MCFRRQDSRWLFSTTIERRFAWQARVTTLLAGLSGLYMLIRLDAWDRFLSARMWWMHAMVMVWLFFTLMLFVAEPFFLHRRLRERARTGPEAAFRAIERVPLVPSRLEPDHHSRRRGRQPWPAFARIELGDNREAQAKSTQRLPIRALLNHALVTRRCHVSDTGTQRARVRSGIDFS
jgi:hypothetical protein